MGEGFADGLAAVDDLAWFVGSVLEKVVQLMQSLSEVDRDSLVDILVPFAAVWTWDGRLGGEMAVVGNLK